MSKHKRSLLQHIQSKCSDINADFFEMFKQCCSLILFLSSWNNSIDRTTWFTVVGLHITLKQLSTKHGRADSLSIREEFDGHQGLNNPTAREVRHVIATDIESSLAFFKVDTTMKIGGWVSARYDKNLYNHVREWDMFIGLTKLCQESGMYVGDTQFLSIVS